MLKLNYKGRGNTFAKMKKWLLLWFFLIVSDWFALVWNCYFWLQNWRRYCRGLYSLNYLF